MRFMLQRANFIENLVKSEERERRGVELKEKGA